MIPLDRFSRREKWARFIADEFWRRDPLSFLGVDAEAKRRGMVGILQRIRERRAELRRGGRS